MRLFIGYSEQSFQQVVFEFLRLNRNSPFSFCTGFMGRLHEFLVFLRPRKIPESGISTLRTA